MHVNGSKKTFLRTPACLIFQHEGTNAITVDMFWKPGAFNAGRDAKADFGEHTISCHQTLTECIP